MTASPVLFVETGSGYGGSAVCLDTLLRFLDRTRFRPMVAHVGEGLAIARIRQQGVETVPVHRGRMWLELAGLIRRERVALVHANNELYSHAATILAAWMTGRPCVVHMRGIRALTRMERALIPLVRHFIVISDIGRHHYVREGVPQARSSTIYDGIDLQAFRVGVDGAAVRRELRVRDHEVLVGIVSRLVPMKGLMEFLEAIALVRQAVPAVRAIVVGGDPEPGEPFLRELKRLSEALGLTETVTFLGWCDEVPAVTAAMDIAVQASRFLEGFGTAIMEAMAMSKPVVATDVGGVPELVQRDTGLLVRVGDIDGMAAAIQRLSLDAEARRQFGRTGRRRIEQAFDQHRLTWQVEAAYQRILGTRGAR